MSICTFGFRTTIAGSAVALLCLRGVHRIRDTGANQSKWTPPGHGIVGAKWLSSSALPKAAAGLFLALGGCVPQAGPGQVVTRVTAPAWKTSAAEQRDNTMCTRDANGIVRSFVQCMEQRGYHIELFGQDGVPMRDAQLPNPSLPAATGLGLSNGPAIPARFRPPQQIPSDQLSLDMQENYRKFLIDAINQDSTAWLANEYDRGSMRQFEFSVRRICSPVNTQCPLQRPQPGASREEVHSWARACVQLKRQKDAECNEYTLDTLVTGRYTFNGGQSGWVEGKFSGNSLVCLRYWDFPANCRPVKTEEDARRAAAIRASIRASAQHRPAPRQNNGSNEPSWTECHYGALSMVPRGFAGMAGCMP